MSLPMWTFHCIKVECSCFLSLYFTACVCRRGSHSRSGTSEAGARCHELCPVWAAEIQRKWAGLLQFPEFLHSPGMCVCQAKSGRLQGLRHFICLNVARQVILCEEQLFNKCYPSVKLHFQLWNQPLKFMFFLKSRLCFCHFFLPQVLIRRTGIPISLSVLYLTIARQLGVKLEPVNFPSHFLLRWCQGKEGWVTCWTLKLCPQWQKPNLFTAPHPCESV